MAITEEINRPISQVFRRAYVKRRSATTGLYESTWQNITEYVVSWGSVSIGIDNIRLNNFTHSGIDLTVDNTAGKFSVETKTTSLWYGYMTRYRSLLKIESGYLDDSGNELPSTVTIGIFIITDEIVINAVTNQGSIRAKSLISVFDEVRAAEVAGLGTINQTASELITKIRDHTDGSSNFVFRNFITSTSWTIQTTTVQYNLATTTSIGEKTCWDLMNSLAECESFVLLVNREGVFEFRDRNERTATSQFAFKGQGFNEQNIISLNEYSEGLNKFYNYFNLKWTTEDTTTSYVSAGLSTTIDPSSSAWKYGVRIYKMDNPFFATSTVAQGVVNNLVTTFQTLKEEIKIKSKFCPQLNILDKVEFSYHSYDLANSTIWDVFNWDESNWAEENDNFDWTDIPFKIISCKHNLNDFSSEFALRRI